MHAKIELRVTITGDPSSFGVYERAQVINNITLHADNTLYLASEFRKRVPPDVEAIMDQITAELRSAYGDKETSL